MATITITRAMNVRRYEDLEIDLDDLTPEQLAVVGRLVRLGAPAIDEADPTERRAFGVLDRLFDDWDVVHEDYGRANHSNVSFTGGE